MSTADLHPGEDIPREILDAALALSEDQRRSLASRHYLSLDPEHSASLRTWPADWRQELERRALAVEQGGPTYSAAEVLDRARTAVERAARGRGRADLAT
jgi:hypothetical protein